MLVSVSSFSFQDLAKHRDIVVSWVYLVLFCNLTHGQIDRDNKHNFFTSLNKENMFSRSFTIVNVIRNNVVFKRLKLSCQMMDTHFPTVLCSSVQCSIGRLNHNAASLSAFSELLRQTVNTQWTFAASAR